MRRHLPVLPDGFADPGLPRGTFSHSQYGAYKKCPTAYEFSYVRGVRAPPSGAMFTGTTIHAGAEAAHLHIIEHQALPVLDAVKAVVSDEFDREKAAVQDWGEGLDAGKTKDRVIHGYASYHHTALPKVKPVAAEQVFVKKVGTVPTIGYVDLIDAPVHGGGLVVADMKTGTSSWSQDDIDRDPQFSLYALVTGIPTVRVDNLVFLKAGPEFKQKSAGRDAQALRNFVEDFEETADLVKRGIFPKAPLDSWQCSARWCSYWNDCRGRKY